MTISPNTTQAEDRSKFKRETIHQLLISKRDIQNEYNHIRICISMWQSFALVDQRGTIWGIHDDLTQAVKDCDEMASLAEDEHEDQRTCYTLIAWKWPVPLDPDKKRSIYVFPDIWVKAPEGFESPITTENPDGLVLASNVNPFDDKYEVYYP